MWVKRRALGALCAAALLAAALPARAEEVLFRAASVAPTPLRLRLAQQRGTQAMPEPGDMVGGTLYRPDGSGPFPAIVSLHGCAGRSAPTFEQRAAARYVRLGYAVLVVDSFTPRSIRQSCIPIGPKADRLGDAFGALDWLAAQPFIDASRVAVMGFSQGASVALFAVTPAGVAQGPGRHFAASIAYYPGCSPAYAVVTVPTLILMGENDDIDHGAICREMMALRHGEGAAETLVVYPGAFHGFDLESLAGHPIEAYGHHLEYSPEADTAATTAAADFLAKSLGR